MKKLLLIITYIIPFFVSGQIYDVSKYYVNDAIYKGILIKTNIPIYNDKTMVKIHFDGHDNGNSATIDFDVCWSINNEEGISTASASAKGGKAPYVTLLGDEQSNKVIIYLKGEFYYPRFMITAFAVGLAEHPDWFANWDITDDEMPNVNIRKDVTYFNQFNDFVGVNGSLAVNELSSLGNINSSGRIINYLQNSGNQGNYSSFSNVNFSQNAYLDNNIWKSYYPKTSGYGNAVVLQTKGNSNKAFNVLVDTSVATSNEDLSFTNLFSININGKIGVGTEDPKELFHINGSMTTQGNNRGYRFNSFYNGSNKFISTGYAASLLLDSTGSLIYSNSSNSGSANGAATLRSSFVINKDGKVGIGTISPQAELAVNGSILAKKVRVTLTNWPDFVFEKNYKLPSLKQVEKYINKYKHLENVPSRDEVLKKGSEIGDMQSILLQKIEELTLYIIDLNKRIEKLEKSGLK
jgi:hypothetical protein